MMEVIVLDAKALKIKIVYQKTLLESYKFNIKDGYSKFANFFLIYDSIKESKNN